LEENGRREKEKKDEEIRMSKMKEEDQLTPWTLT
jgi:hypothetical protein